MSDNGEAQGSDLKLTIDITNPKAKLDLLKNLVAMANAGGGKITFGRDEVERPGIDDATRRELDSARLATAAERIIRPAKLTLSHIVAALPNGRYIYTLNIAAAEYPIVMSRQGDWAGMNNRTERPLFNIGDVWTRHGTRTERISYDDLRAWIESAKHREREIFLERISKVINVPDGAEIQIVTHANGPIDTPNRMVEYAKKRRERDTNHLLGTNDLLELFVNRQLLDIDQQAFSLLIASALRRNSTLYWWLTQNIADKRLLVLQEVNQCLSSNDRDKSDAGKNIIEMLALYASENETQAIVEQLRESSYKHFREAVEGWVDCATIRHRTRERIEKSAEKKQGNRTFAEHSVDELELLASNCAAELQDKSSSALSRRLGDITRVIWSKCDPKFESL